MSSATLNLTPSLYTYLLDHSLHEPEVLKELREETRKQFASMLVMQISPEQGQFMRLLIEVLGARKTLDIGTFTGYSALSVALAMPSDGQVIACDVSPEWTTLAESFWQKGSVAHKIQLHLAPALSTLENLLQNGEAETFDFAFIDADKENYAHYYEKSLALLRKGGIIAIDNVLWDGKVSDQSVQDASTIAIRQLNAKVFADERVSMTMLPVGDGLTLARKR
ncbi:MAG: class I SAM-dependent methyltransferase [Gammaproteobacteria bacterium]|nr:class I SAM-dependent methyltransferase [Gammaproteobacteria bacterium]